MSGKDGNQGEGNRRAARRFNQRTQRFVDSAAGREAIDQAGQDDERTRKELRKAEREAASHAAETDPAVTRNYRGTES